MKEWEQSIKNLQQHVGQLIKVKDQLQAELGRRDLEVQKLKGELEQLKKETEIMDMQHAMLKASQQMLSESEKKVLEKKLQSFINEIDHCIGLLGR
jgi:predicted nuclease with TOPRIM domain